LGIVNEVIEQPDTEFTRGDSDIFLLIREDDVVDASLAGCPRFATPDLSAREILELQRHVLEHMPHPCTFSHPPQKSAGFSDGTSMIVERRNQFRQTFIKARNF